MSDPYEKLTDAELAMKVYVAIVNQDHLSDSDMEAFRPAWEMAKALALRLSGPYCEMEGCKNEHMSSYPWCPWHRPESYGPLPPDFPANPNLS